MRVAIALLLIEICLAWPASAATFAEGRSAYDLNKVADARRIYAEVAHDAAASAADRSASERELARIAWLIDADNKLALQHLDAARQIGDNRCDTSELIARVLRGAHRAVEAAQRSAEILDFCPDEAARNATRTHIVGALVDLAWSDAPRRADWLERAKAEAARFTPDADIEAARVRLELALLSQDAPSALQAWKDYFGLDEADAPHAYANAGAGDIFRAGLTVDASPADQLKLADLLARTGFLEPSRRLATQAGLARTAKDDPSWKRLAAYYAARERFDARMLQQHRRFAHEGGSEKPLKIGMAEIESMTREFRSSLAKGAGIKPDDRAGFQKAYGFIGTDPGMTNGYPSVLIGHVIEDRDDQVAQYGHSAKIHYIAIDNMITNGFTSWLWDGSAMVGGWQADGVIVNVRQGSVRSPLRHYQQTRDGEARRGLIDLEKSAAKQDIAALRSRPVATLNGLNHRLTLQLVDRVAAVARARSTDEASFRRAFLAEFARANFDQSIQKHEGRHAIDEAMGVSAKVEPAVLEYQAKLSELALTDYPRMALRGINRNLEGDSQHDRAGAKIFDEYRRWMEAHREQVMGYDPALPALVQLDKLTDSQIREIARSLDPLPNGRASPAKL